MGENNPQSVNDFLKANAYESAAFPAPSIAKCNVNAENSPPKRKRKFWRFLKPCARRRLGYRQFVLMKIFLKTKNEKDIFRHTLSAHRVRACDCDMGDCGESQNKPLILPSPDVVLKNFSRSGERRDSGARSDFPCFELYGVLRRRL